MDDIDWVNRFEFVAPEALVAVEIALQCGSAMLGASDLGVEWKGAADPVTIVDRENEALAVAQLAAAFPTHLVIGEEASAERGSIPVLTSAPTWIIDPIDGTTNFTHGAPLSCVSIGFVRDAVPIIGIVYDPNADELYVGVRGHGAFRNGVRIAADAIATTVPDSLVLVDPGYERSAAGVAKFTKCMAALLIANVQAVRILGSAVLSICWVASGRANAYFGGLHEKDCPKPWDWTAAYVIGTEAGVRFARLDARGYDRESVDAKADAIDAAAACVAKTDAQTDSEAKSSDGAFDIYSKSCLCAGHPALLDEIAALVDAAVRGARV